MKVLIIQQKMIGDVLTSSILFEAIKKKYPKAELHYILNTNTYAVVEHNPFIDEFIFITPETAKSNIQFWMFLKKIKKQDYNVVIDVYGKWSSNLMSLFSKSKIKVSYYKWYSHFFYTHTVKRKKEPETISGLACEHRIQLLEKININNKTIFKPKIYLSKNEIDTAKKLLLDNGIQLTKKLYMLNILGSAKNKTYPLKFMAIIIDYIVNQTKAQILFNYIPNQNIEAKRLFNLCSIKTQNHIKFNLYAKSLRKFLAITSHCNALIGNEGGAINMAKALDIPTFSIMSPWIDRETWGTFENKNNVSIHLKDFKTELYRNKTEKSMKNIALNLYEELNPEFLLKQLQHFLT